VLDTETTGFTADDRVIEIGLVLLGDDLSRQGTWETLVNPQRGVGPTHVHRLRQADVADAPLFAQAAGPLAARLAGRVLVGHNLAFDRRMLNQEYRRLGLGQPLGPGFSLDTLNLARRLRLSPTRSYTLDHLCQVLAIDRAGAHAALDDALATADLFVLATRRLSPPASSSRPVDTATESAVGRWPELHALAEAATWPRTTEAPFVARPRRR
jgi:DNA polymerase-3 subunit epsilon